MENLLELGFKVNTLGFKYWIKAIEIYKKDGWRYGFTMQYLYEEIANYYETTKIRVERALRTCSDTAKDNLQMKYQYSGKITNKVILDLLTFDYYFRNIREEK